MVELLEAENMPIASDIISLPIASENTDNVNSDNLASDTLISSSPP